MTRLLYLPDDATVIQLEVEMNVSQLCAAINAGMRPIALLRNAPPGKLTANEIGATVIVAPVLPHKIPAKPDRTLSGLSRRQAQVHELSVRGLTSGEIAIMLHLSRRTVNYHLNQVKNRLRIGEIPHSKMVPIPLKFDNDP